MKSVLFAIAASFLILNASAQSVVNPYPKTITVNGSAEMEVVPDEIYVQVVLKEYEKKGQGKVTIDRIRQDFLAAVRSLNIADSLVSIAGYDGSNENPWLKKKKKKEELYASISYQVKLKSSTQADQLVDKLDDAATQNFMILRTSHSKLAEFRKQLKIEAVKAAKEKARYLSSAIGESLGVAVTISEPVEYYQPYYNTRLSNTAMKMEMDQSEPDQADFTKIKLRYDVNVVFALN